MKLFILFTVCLSGVSFADDKATAPVPGKAYSIDTPQGRAMHEQMMHTQQMASVQTQQQQRQDTILKLQERSELQTQLTTVNKTLETKLNLTAVDRKQLLEQKKKLEKQIAAYDHDLKAAPLKKTK